MRREHRKRLTRRELAQVTSRRPVVVKQCEKAEDASATDKPNRRTRGKTERFFDLYHQGFSRAAIASKLRLTLEQVDQLFEALGEPRLEGEEAIATQGVGGGQG